MLRGWRPTITRRRYAQPVCSRGLARQPSAVRLSPLAHAAHLAASSRLSPESAGPSADRWWAHRAFLVYVISHNRPMAEVLAPTRKSLREELERGFAGMTQEPAVLADLEAAREAIIAAMVVAMPEDHRRFLVGFKRSEPDWGLLGIPEAQHLASVIWKQRNLAKLPDAKRREMVDALERVLFP